MTEEVNGFPISRASAWSSAKGSRDSRVILVDRGTDYQERWVTAIQCRDMEGWIWGHYFDDEAEAVADFNSREVRGY